MKTVLPVCLIVALLLAGCSGSQSESLPRATQDPASAQATAAPAMANRVTEKILKSELIPDGSELSPVLSESVSLTVTQAAQETVEITVTAPDISQDLMAWLRDIPEEEYSDEALAREIERLLAEKQEQTQTFTLPVENGEIVYTAESANAAHCGLDAFLYGLPIEALQDMGGAEE